MQPDQPIDVPQPVATWPLDECSVTNRLRNALRKHGYRTLGELHGVTLKQLHSLEGVGVGSLHSLAATLRKLAANGSGAPSISTPEGAAMRVVEVVDEYCLQLTTRNRDIFLTRLGGNREPVTLAAIGDKHHVTRERIRQVVMIHLEELRRFGGPPFIAMLRKIEERCLASVCPLRPELLNSWLRSRKVSGCYAPAFYVRVIGEILTSCPAWPEGRENSTPTPAQLEVTAAIKESLAGRFVGVASVELLRMVQQTPSLARLTAAEFLAALQADASVEIKFARTDQLLVLPSAPDPVMCVKKILEGSDVPLPLAEIIRRARDDWDGDVLPVAAYRVNRILRPDDGVFQFDEDTYGLLKHIRLPQGVWDRVRDDAVKYLEEEKWSVTTFEMVQRIQADWTRLTTPYELAAILRDDARMVDLGRCLFALALPAPPAGVVVVQPAPALAGP